MGAHLMSKINTNIEYCTKTTTTLYRGYQINLSLSWIFSICSRYDTNACSSCYPAAWVCTGFKAWWAWQVRDWSVIDLLECTYSSQQLDRPPQRGTPLLIRAMTASTTKPARTIWPIKGVCKKNCLQSSGSFMLVRSNFVMRSTAANAVPAKKGMLWPLRYPPYVNSPKNAVAVVEQMGSVYTPQSKAADLIPILTSSTLS